MLCNDRMPPYPRPGRFRPTVAILKIICFLQSVNMLIKNVLAVLRFDAFTAVYSIDIEL